MPKRCLIYCRFSDEMQSARSVDDQEREARAWAQREGWEVIGVESDAAVRAGAMTSRVGYARVLEAAKAKRFDILLVEEVSRFSRDFLGGFSEISKLKDFGVQLADTKTGVVDLGRIDGQLRIAFGLAGAEQETQRLGERAKRGQKGKTLSGFSSGGQPAYGYVRKPIYSSTLVDVDGRPKREGVRFEPHPSEAPIVKHIFEMYRDGYSKGGIAKRLNFEGIATRRVGGTYDGRPTTGAWTTSGIKSLLENKLYTGTREWNVSSRTGEKLPRTGKKRQHPNPADQVIVVQNFVTPLIAQELFDVVAQRRLVDATKYAKQHVVNQDRRYLLSGLIVCAHCGRNFVVGAHQGKPRVPHYRCGHRAASGPTVCSNKVCISQPALEKRVRHMLDVIVKDPVKLEALVREHNRRISATNDGQLAAVRLLEARVQLLKQQEANLVEAVANGTGGSRALVTRLDQVGAELADLANRKAAAEAHIEPLLLPKMATVRDFAKGSASLFDADTESNFVASRELLTHAIVNLVVYPDGALVLRFREASLFEPVSELRLGSGDAATSTPLTKLRSAASKELSDAKRAYREAAGSANQANAEVHVEEDREGNPAFIVFTEGAVTVTRKGDSPEANRKRAWASSAGFEPA